MPATRSVAEQELINSLGWLIRMRWFAGAAVLAATAITVHLVGLPVPERQAYLIGLAILGYNLLFLLAAGRLDEVCPRFPPACQWFARIQIAFDWLAMTVLISLSGGIESPAILFFLFHIAIASLLLPHEKGFLYVALAPVLVGTVAGLEASGVLRHVALVNPPRFRDPIFVAEVLVFFTCASYVMAYLAMAISRRLRKGEAEIAGLYEIVRTATSTLDLSQVLDRLSEATTRVLACKGAAIRLLDPHGTKLVAAASYGLSDEFMSAALELSRSSIDREVLARNTVLFIDALNDPRLLFPEANRKEGITTILVAPLVGKAGPMGVLRAYGAAGHEFNPDDARFLAAVASQSAIALENAQAYQMLRSIDRDKSQFVQTVTHELRSPIQVSHNLLTLLEQGYVGVLSSEQADLVTRARCRIEFLQTLVDDLLDLAAGKADHQLTTERKPLDLAPLVLEVCGRFLAAAKARGLTLRASTDQGTLTMRADARELDRIVNNLVANAVRYTVKGEVTVALARDGDTARITVADTGIGIPQDALPRLFEEFFRAPNAKVVEERGTGLGLAIVKTLVERYHGTIDVKSTEGEGTTFIVRLPLAFPETAEAEAIG